MESNLHWQGPLTISKRAELDSATTTLEVEFLENTIYWQKQILIEALEGFLKNFGGFRA
jgi:hypothetical protein